MTFGDAFMRNYFVAYNKTGNIMGLLSKVFIVQLLKPIPKDI